ncbi:DNA topoisomerase 2-alpha-like isoform X2 [Limulus polyphemus]|uniref:DNA topoisomerase 2 n=1 Tax=Limulus polyphemus TaxID=6850 RepID=A0ABM1RY77_LIMPO|nr:DNA topoisomerase 2-alpha-like isoform X2 [Limulus polyphemus]
MAYSTKPEEMVFQPIQLEEENGLVKDNKKTNKRLSVERIYQKKTQLEHILLRPDTYVGSVEPITQSMWVYDDEVSGMVNKEITFVPGLYKIFDEILVNAADNKQRDKNMDCIKIDIDPQANKISIWNNGKGIPVVEHKVEKMFVPSLIFGHLLTSSNYNDEEKKVTGGRNGYGAKLCNIFSKKFVVETSSKEYGKSFKQTWTDNMMKTTDAKITPFHGEDFTRITFYPDLAKFKMEMLDNDTVAFLSRRAYDIAGSTRGVKVHLNGKRLPVKSFKDYAEQYVKGKEDEQGNPLKIVYENVNERWEVAITLSDRGFQHVSFANSIATTKGGRHVDYVADQIVNKLVEVVKKKNKGGVQVKPFQIKNHMWIFVNCLIENPTFDSQTKENMTLQVKSFGSKCQPSEKFLNQVMKCGIVESIMTWVRFKAQTQLNTKCSAKKHSKLKGIPKLEDANDAGTKNSIDCTLILTEGDSAKSLAVSGLSVIGRDKYGVFPLRGKMLNVREATHKQILENAEINNIIKIMGLQYKKKYESIEDLRTLRYGRLMIMTDQDQDGSHIKGLLINFIHHNWPSLLHLPFLEQFITPIVKAVKGKEEKSFYSLPEFEEWKTQISNWNTWKIKYYKGLGTSTAKEAREYFADMARHRIKFKYEGSDDDSAIQLAFSKKMVEQRKEWLTNGMEERKHRRELGLPELYVYGKATSHLTFNDFINKELILFSNMDNERSIPSLVDGLKPGQRKVIFTCFKRNDKREIKVAQFAGSVAELSAYHHGENSLMATIINLAQNFVGSNNINLLQPIGQFGTRLQGGKDSASPRYIFTMLSPLAKHIFSSLDEPLLNHLYEDNQKIEPEFYVPIIPMILVNGAEGIGTGWSTKIPNYNPREIVENLRRMIVGEEPKLMKPWFKNFRGSIEQLDSQRFVISGEVAILGTNKLEITELPVRTWTQSYKEQVLEPMVHGTEKTKPIIIDYKEYHTDTTVKFLITINEDKLAELEHQGLHKVFKLQSTVNTTSMVLFDHTGVLRKYESPQEILTEFFTVRLEYYAKRKAYLEGMFGAETNKLENQARFILEKIEGKVVVENKKKVDLIRTLVERGYDSDPVKAWKKAALKQQLEKEGTMMDESESSDDEEGEAAGPDFDYLLGMNMWSLTKEKKDELLKKRDEKRKELEDLKQKSPADLWQSDLQSFMEELDKVEKKEKEDEEAGISGNVMKAAHKQGGGKSRPKKMALEETKPSPMSQRIIPHIDPELRKKVEKPAGGAGEVKKRGRMKKEADGEFNKEEDDEPMPLAERIGNSPEKYEQAKAKKTLKQQIKPSPKKSLSSKKKGPKRNPWSASESEPSSSEESDVEASDYIPPEKRTTAPRRAAASKAKYNFDSEEEEEEHENFKPNYGAFEDDIDRIRLDLDGISEEDEPPSRTKTKTIKKSQPEPHREEKTNENQNGRSTPEMIISDSEDSFDAPPSRTTKKTDDTVGGDKDGLFDSLLGGSSPDKKPDESMSSLNIEPSTVPSAKSVDSGSSTDDDERANKQRESKVKQKEDRSDGSDNEFIPEVKKSRAIPKKPTTGGGEKRKKKEATAKPAKRPKKDPKKKAKSDSDDNDDESEVKCSSAPAPRSRSARSCAPIKYNFGDESSDEGF